MNEIYKTNAVKALQKIDNTNNYCTFYSELDHNYQIDDIVYLYIVNIFYISKISLDNINYHNYLDSYYNYTTNSIIGYKIISTIDNKIILDIKYDSLLQLYSGITTTLNSTIKYNDIYITKILTKDCIIDKYYDNTDLIINSTILNNTIFTGYTYNNLSLINLKQAILINITNTLYNITFNNKYSNDYLTTNYKLDELDNIIIFFTQNNNGYGYTYYINVNIINTKSINNGIFLTDSNNYNTITNSNIYNGYFENYNLVKNMMYYSYCKNCITSTDLSNIWYNGIWNNTNSISYFTYKKWMNGIWLNGTTSLDMVWYDGSFEYGLFTNSIWENGTFNNGEFYTSIWKKGVFNNGSMTNGSKWYSGIMNGGIMKNGIFNNGTINNGYIGGEDNVSLINYCIFNNGTIHNTTIKNCIFNNGLISNSIWYNGKFYNGTFLNSIWEDGTFYDGYFYSGSTFQNGTINNGLFEYSILDADNHKDIIMNFATIKNSYMRKVIINNAIINNSTEDLFEYNVISGKDNGAYYYYYNAGGTENYKIRFCYIDNCIINNCTLNDGVISDSSLWYNGKFNYGIFEETSIWYYGIFYDGYFRGEWKDGIFYTGDPTIVMTGNTILPDIPNMYFKIFNATQSATTYYMIPYINYKNTKPYKQYEEILMNNNSKNTNYSNTHIDAKGRLRKIKQNYTQEDLFKIKKTNSDLTSKQQSVFNEIYNNLQNLNDNLFSTSGATYYDQNGNII